MKTTPVKRLSMHRRASRRSSDRLLLIILLLVSTLYFFICQGLHFGHFPSPYSFLFEEDLLCRHLPGADNVLVLLKTGATEIERLPVHLETTFRCTHHFVVYSDLNLVVNGQPVYDILENVTDEVKLTEKDFAIYWKLQASQRLGKDPQALLIDPETATTWENPAWRLDKWKFLPMVQKAAEYRNVDWYLFMEMDTALVWSNMLTLMSLHDPSQEHYLGSQSSVGSRVFAHGGSGFLLSRPAVVRAAVLLHAEQTRFEKSTPNECCGDYMLGLALQELDIRLAYQLPVIQGETPRTFKYGAAYWCRPVASYHKMSPDETREVWAFEQQRTKDGADSLLHADVFDAFVRPSLAPSLKHWDNMCMDMDISKWDVTEGAGGNASFDACRLVCAAKPSCMQFKWMTGACHLGDSIRLGRPAEPVEDWQSGWMLDRIELSRRAAEPCMNVW